MSSLPLVILLCVLAPASCAPAHSPRDNPKGFGTAKYVLVIGCDGFGEFLEVLITLESLEAFSLVQIMFFFFFLGGGGGIRGNLQSSQE